MVTIRVTQNMVTQQSLSSLQSGLNQLARTQEKLSTGKVINRASDSPTEATVAMKLRAQVAREEQYVRNAENGLGWLSVVDSTLGQMTDNVRRARELALQGANAASTPETREAIAVEIDQIREGLISQANTTYLDRPVFGGVTAGSRAFDASGAYVGVDGAVRRTVADGVTVRLDVAGTSVVGPDGANLFDDLAALSTALRTGDQSGIGAGADALRDRLTGISTAQSTVGAAYNRAEAAIAQGNDRVLALRTELSQVEDADLPATMVDLQMHEIAYQAALSATSRVMQPSLVDFLR